MNAERLGEKREAGACVAYQELNQFKLKIAGPKPVTIEKPNYLLTAWTLTGNLHTETSTDTPEEKGKIARTV